MTTTSARLDAALARVEAQNDTYRAFVRVMADEARAAAARADAAAAEGRSLGLLHGMIVAVKDNIDVAGEVSGCGSRFFADAVAAADAPVVARLRRAGAVVVAKTSMNELAFGARSTDQLAGQVRNAWNTDHIPGGSSGGSGVAPALGFCDVALGTDTGGSVRVPASFNGIAGLRPTLGRVPNTGCLPVAASFDTIGPLGADVVDLARVHAAISGYDDADPTSVDRPTDDVMAGLGRGVEGLSIGVLGGFYRDAVDPDVAAAVDAAAEVFRGLGARLVPVELDGAAECNAHATTLILAEACELHQDRLDSAPDMFSRQVYERMIVGRERTSVDVARALRAREAWRRTVARAFRAVDLFLLPTAPVPAAPIEDGRRLAATTADAVRFTYGGSFARLPALSLPCGFTGDGLPVGVALEAPPWAEALLLRAGFAFQQATDWHLRRPEGGAA